MILLYATQLLKKGDPVLMNHPDCLLAEIPGFGRVYDCGDCGNIHVTVGPVSLTLTPDAYMQLVALVNTSAANFETWLQERQSSSTCSSQHEEGFHVDHDPKPDQMNRRRIDE